MTIYVIFVQSKMIVHVNFILCCLILIWKYIATTKGDTLN